MPTEPAQKKDLSMSMYRYVGHVSAIEKSEIEQVWSRKRPSSR